MPRKSPRKSPRIVLLFALALFASACGSDSTTDVSVAADGDGDGAAQSQSTTDSGDGTPIPVEPDGGIGDGDSLPDDHQAVVHLFVDEEAIHHAAVDLGDDPAALIGVGDGGQPPGRAGLEPENDAELAFVDIGGKRAERDDVLDHDFGHPAEKAPLAVGHLFEDHLRIIGALGFHVE